MSLTQALVLCIALCIALCVAASAAAGQPFNSASCVEASAPEGMLLLAADVSIVDNGVGHRGEVTIHEYDNPGSTTVPEQDQNGIKSKSMYPEDAVDIKKYSFDMY